MPRRRQPALLGRRLRPVAAAVGAAGRQVSHSRRGRRAQLHGVRAAADRGAAVQLCCVAAAAATTALSARQRTVSSAAWPAAAAIAAAVAAAAAV
eukprot:3636963-Prymnesium_polylepis.1